MPPSLTNTLDLLKERGFSPGDRAFLAKEWMTFSVHFRGNRDPLHFTEYHKEREVFSEKNPRGHTGSKKPRTAFVQQ